MEIREVALRAGESYELRLTGRGARGYVWTWQVTGDTDAVAVAEGGAAPGGTVPGGSVEQTYLVRGRCPGGRARIRFAQIRPPYPDEAPYDEFVLDVEVTP
ncbi:MULTISPECIES: protease inhibitor I42 family protein [unclassified Streptomyces]|uniref:protease inhibitor I42 family protein n=1 Tax=unclassified Streptomyces TaxID=2593676 RepID=UPI0022590A39|nr:MULTISPECIES: protease inhibitor I42 family protein [unclassified Streptomyces]MCX4526927.1 protease inhibitor I42 family protein [Streptomyces sp. NBC_01551]MCX4542513.1 protease inhibitor I42 family protein [Streptomyces sp. NBC_01565]